MEQNDWDWVGDLKYPQVTLMVSNSQRHTIASSAQTPHCLDSHAGPVMELKTKV